MATLRERANRSDDELREATDHLFYEWSMLMRLADRLRTKKRPQDIQNA